MSRPKQPEDYVRIVQEYDYVCAKCNTRHPQKTTTCFVCGSTDTIKYDKIKSKTKTKSTVRGGTVKINF